MNFSFSFMIESLVAACGAIPLSLGLTISAIIAGIIIGTPIALMRFYRVPFVEPVFKVVIALLRGIPLMLFFLVAYRLMSPNPIFSRPFIATFVLSIPATIHVSEMVRGLS
jgi:L-cystine transport system permease protein